MDDETARIALTRALSAAGISVDASAVVRGLRRLGLTLSQIGDDALPIADALRRARDVRWPGNAARDEARG